MNIAISSGHGKFVPGASGVLQEHPEAVRVVNRTAELLQAAGVGVKVFHDDTSHSQNENLNAIVDFHNAQTRDLDVSVHFNAGANSTAAPVGTECLYITQAKLAGAVSSAIAGASGLPNRGPKKRTDLFFLNNTKMPAILIETCFVDSSGDANLYNQHFDAICQAIATTIGGIQAPSQSDDFTTLTISADKPTKFKIVAGTNVTLVAGDSTTVIPSNQQNIIATWFDATQQNAYGVHVGASDFYIALPFRFSGDRKKVRVYNSDTKEHQDADIVDVGPWLIDDPYWTTGQRPLAETCYKNHTPLPRGPNAGKIPNGAGIDLSHALMTALGVEGKGIVDWEFL